MIVDKLFAPGNLDALDSNPDARQWLARAVAGAIVADRKIRDQERPFIEALVKVFKSDPDTFFEIHNILRNRQPPLLEPLTVDRKIAEQTIKCIIDICVSDNEMEADEAKFIRKTARMLGFSDEEADKFVHRSLVQVKMDFFESILNALFPEERYWLAVVILKMIYADEEVSKREVQYLQDVYNLLDGDRKELDSVKANVNSLALNSLPKVFFSDDLCRKIVKYMLQILMGDQDFDEREAVLIFEVADIIGYPRELVDELIDDVRLTYIAHEQDIQSALR